MVIRRRRFACEREYQLHAWAAHDPDRRSLYTNSDCARIGGSSMSGAARSPPVARIDSMPRHLAATIGANDMTGFDPGRRTEAPSTSSAQPRDVRMRGFSSRAEVADVWQRARVAID